MANEVEILVKSVDKTKTGFDSADQGVSKLGSTISKVGKVAAVGFAAAGAAAVSFGKAAIDEAREAQKVSAQTEAVLKSTGGAANVTAKEVENLAGKLSMKAGIDDEVIQSGENMLLTFTNIRNEVGKGNDIFNQATGIALDMSVALGTDMKGASVLVGKALNDPIKGVSALTRVGVAFTDQQKAQIEKMVEAGNTMGAQKLILGELNKEFKGSAAAQATAGDKLKVIWGNFMEMVGTKLLPLLDKLIMWFINKGIPAIREFAESTRKRLQPMIQWIKDNWPEIQRTIQRVIDRIVGDVRAFIDLIVKIWRKWGDDISRFAKIIFDNIKNQIRGALKVIQGIINIVTGLIKGDWSRVWNGIKQITSGVWILIKNAIQTPLKLIREIIRSAWDAVKDLTKKAWNAILDQIKRLGNAIKDYFKGVFNTYRDIIRNAWDAIKNVSKKAWDWYRDTIKRIFEFIKDYIRTVFNIYKEVITRVWDAIRDRTRNALDAVKNVVKNAFDWVRDKIRDSVDAWRDRINNGWERIKDIIGRLKEAVRSIPDAFRAAKDAIGNVWDKIKGIIARPVDFVLTKIWNPLVSAFDKIPGVDVGGWKSSGIKGYRRGGYTGDGDKNAIAGVTHGREFVINAESTEKIERHNPGFLARLNRTGLLPGHKKGGFVNPMRRVYVDGEPLTAVHAAQLMIAGHLMGTRQHVIQGSWQAPSSYSGTSHTGPGVADTSPGSFRAQYVQRRAGIAAWARNIAGAAYAGSGAHVHGVSMFSAPGNSQLAAYKAGGDGLGGRDYGARPGLLPGLFQKLRRFNPIVLSGAAGGIADMTQGIVKAASGGLFDIIGKIKDGLSTMRDRGGMWPMISKVPGAFLDEIKDFALNKIKAAAKAALEAPKNWWEDWASGFTRPFDNGGTLAPGWNRVYNATGKPEHLINAEKQTVTIELRAAGSGLDQLLLEVLRKSIRVKGGNVQVVLGT